MEIFYNSINDRTERLNEYYKISKVRDVLNLKTLSNFLSAFPKILIILPFDSQRSYFFLLFTFKGDPFNILINRAYFKVSFVFFIILLFMIQTLQHHLQIISAFLIQMILMPGRSFGRQIKSFCVNL